jgi:hypothetical protein
VRLLVWLQVQVLFLLHMQMFMLHLLMHLVRQM